MQYSLDIRTSETVQTSGSMLLDVTLKAGCKDGAICRHVQTRSDDLYGPYGHDEGRLPYLGLDRNVCTLHAKGEHSRAIHFEERA